MLPSSWKPQAVGGQMRLGPEHDGGYVVSRRAVAASKLLISMGLNDDWRFEEAFQSSTGARVICFDGSVDRRFWALYIVKKFIRLRPQKALHYLAYRRFFGSGRAEHRQQMIGYDGHGSVSLDTVLAEQEDTDFFLKVDIEGAEYRILDQIVANRARLTGIVMELHDIDLHRDRLTAFFAAMSGFTLVALVANNFGGTDPAGDPLVIEISLTRDDLSEPVARAELAPLAAANDPSRPVIPVCFGGANFR